MLTHSVHGVEWCQRKYGPHGELYFFLRKNWQRSRSVRPSVPSSMLTSVPPSSLLMSQEVCAPRLAHNCGRRKRRRWISSPWFGRRIESGLCAAEPLQSSMHLYNARPNALQGKTPTLLLHVVDIDVCLPRANFLSPKRQFIWALPDRHLCATF